MAKRRLFGIYTRPGFLEGVARVLDIGDTFNWYPRFRTAAEADAFALRSDWEAVGQDIRDAIGEFEEIRVVNESPPLS